MKKLAFGLFLSCALLGGTLSVPAQTQASPAKFGVKVQVDDSLIDFPDTQPFVDEQHRLQVPLRFVSEQIGYQVDWAMAGQNVKVTLHKDNRHIELKTSQQDVYVNGEQQTLDTHPSLIGGRVYVPLRFIAESTGIRVQWDQQNSIAILNADGHYHAPAWYAPAASTFEASAYSADHGENGGYGAVDYFGNPLELGTVAVDPAVIPLGSELYIEGYDFNGLPVGGMKAKATDTGGSIKGKRLDIFIPGANSLIRSFGLQRVKVYVLH